MQLGVPEPDARELVKQSALAMQRYHSYRIDAVTVIDMKGGAFNNRIEMPTTVAVRRPDRMRVESKSEAADMTIVSDGENTWIHMLPANQYVKRAAASSPDAAVLQSGLLQKLPDINKSIRSIKLTGQDTLEIEGKKYQCWLVETRFDKIEMPSFATGGTIQNAVQIMWIDKERNLLLQNSFGARINAPALGVPIEMLVSTLTTSLQIEPELADSLFVFTPPEDSKVRADWTLPGIERPAFVGKPAPALQAKAMDGSPINVASLKGKVVLLDFWATWCAPCTRELPLLEKLSREFRAKGLVVMGVDVGEERAVVEKFLKTAGVTYPIAPITLSDETLAAYSISSYPTVVLIDREGKVASYEIGARGEAALRADLKKLGLTAKP
ncbi:MAG TPA: redoxin domain-containing protein [Bryobacteraceae bacterium]|jgi:thiol-disulfide isomerase/thioredoxin|nr:redoxin domain-containing protein [Bryobacteraceae bacterium]